MKNAPCHGDCGERRPSIKSISEKLSKLRQRSLSLQAESCAYNDKVPMDKWRFSLSLQKWKTKK